MTWSQTLKAASISASWGDSCASMQNGQVDCWGWNYLSTHSAVPARVNGISGAVSVSLGIWYDCALLASHEALCWGDGSYGRLGDGSTEDSGTPMHVAGLSSAVALSTGAFHACAVLASGGVDCWGRNQAGQLGDGSYSDSSTPRPVSGISNAVAVSAGFFLEDATCALLASGQVRCWGGNGAGQLGNGTTKRSNVPVSVHGITDAISVAAGGQHACAVLRSGGRVECWGDNDRGQLGNGTTRGSHVPVTVKGLSGARQVAADPRGYSCAVLFNGRVYCWGQNNKDQLGDGTRPRGSLVPVAVTGIYNAVAVSTSDSHACALLASGGADCWGGDDYGQLGDNRAPPITGNARPVRFP